jgi:hypothetical protein
MCLYKLANRKSANIISIIKNEYSLLVRGRGKSPKIDKLFKIYCDFPIQSIPFIVNGSVQQKVFTKAGYSL